MNVDVVAKTLYAVLDTEEPPSKKKHRSKKRFSMYPF